MVLNCVIVDDEPLALDLLEGYVARTPFLKLAARCGSPMEALSVAGEQEVDLFFLDIQMPHLSGLELSHLLGERAKVIFTTAFDQYAVEGFRAEALDYLLKPISYPEFLRAANRALRWFEMAGREQAPKVSAPQRIFVKSDYKLVQVEIDRIAYVEGVKDYIRIVREDGSSIMTLMSMKSFEERLPADKFVRVHRSYIVNMDKISVIDRNRIVFGKVYIPISDSYKESFSALFDQRTVGYK